MSRSIEIYVRQSGQRVLLNIYVPEAERAQFLDGLSNGTFESQTSTIAVELSLLPAWVTDAEVRAELEAKLNAVHARIPITAINVHIAE